MAFSTHDIVPDSPTNNFATLNSLSTRGTTTSGTWAQDGNLKALSDTSAAMVVFSTMSFSTRKYYTEFLVVNTVENNDHIGIAFDSVVNDTLSVAAEGGTCVAYKASGQKLIDGSLSNYNNSYTDGNLIGVFVDLDNNEVTFYKEGISQGTITGVISGTYLYRVRFNNVASQQSQCIVNFGQDPTFGGSKSPTTTYTDANGIGEFYYQPPTGAKALCTANLPDFTPTVTGDTPQDYFKAVIWSGTTYANATVPVGFTPDFVWAKSTNTSGNHRLVDSVRGGNGSLMYEISSNDAGGNGTDSSITGLSNNGINLSSGNFGASSGQDFVAWCFRAGGPPDLTSSPTKPFAKNGVQYETLSAANITAGTITPTAMSVNTDAGFSIVKYGGSNTTGLLSSSVSSATIPHGLNDCEFCIIKNLDNANTWVVSHTSITPNVMALQDTGVAASTPPVDPTYGQITSLNSNTVTITRGSTRGDNVGENLNSWGYIMYCWHSVEGYSKFGSYVGNGSADGPFVYCGSGFRPAFVLVKSVSVAGYNWYILDSARNIYNPEDKYLLASNSGAEGTYPLFDFLSNGFKIVNVGDGHNASGGTYIFMAFAEQPFKYANAR